MNLLQELPYIMPYQNLVFFCLGLGLLILAIRFGDRKARYLRKNGMPSIGTVISIKKTLIRRHENNSTWSPIMKIVLGVEADGVEYRQVTIKDEFLLSQLPNEGDKVNILIDPRNPDKVMIVDVVQVKDNL
jgi:hypothetical protein